MIAVDANLLVYARVSSYAQHDAARVWLEEQLVRVPRVGAAVGESAGVRAAGHQPRLFSEPESITDAWAQVVAWLDADPVWTPTTRHRDTGTPWARVWRSRGYGRTMSPTPIWPLSPLSTGCVWPPATAAPPASRGWSGSTPYSQLDTVVQRG